MLTTKRFTPGVLARFTRQRRGEGIHENYRPWHGVSRGDPASRGRSHLVQWRGRQLELLSDGELVAALFSMQVPGLVDLREQFPLQNDQGVHELAPYLQRPTELHFSGTETLAARDDIRHPEIGVKTERVPWVMSTDQLLTINHDHQLRLCAVSCKPDSHLSKRSKELLTLEREYWMERGATWLFLTPEIYDPRVALSLRRMVPWIIGEHCTEVWLKDAASLAFGLVGMPRHLVIKEIGRRLGSLEAGQRAFWQAVFTGLIPMDLTAGWRPSEELRLLPAEDFWAQNPVVMGRSAWN